MLRISTSPARQGEVFVPQAEHAAEAKTVTSARFRPAAPGPLRPCNRTVTLGLHGHTWFTRSHLVYMGGVMPSRPTRATVASHVPSALFSHLGMKILAPGFRSSRSPGIKFTTVASEGTTIVFSPSLYFSMRVFPSAFLTCCVTAALVMELFGIRSHG